MTFSTPSLQKSSSLRILSGFLLLIIGSIAALPGVPGPGIPVILLGLWILSDHFAWAKRSLAWVREKTARFRRPATNR